MVAVEVFEVIELKDNDVFELAAAHVPHVRRKATGDLPLGPYVVVHTVAQAGFGAGHHVYCECLADRSVEINFRQWDHASCPMRDIALVGRAEWKLVFEGSGK